jgi:triacylglycerol lipase
MSWHVIKQEQGDNDGLVPVTSASYGEEADLWEGDHVSLVNFPDPFARATRRWPDRTAAYGGLLRRLALLDAGSPRVETALSAL